MNDDSRGYEMPTPPAPRWPSNVDDSARLYADQSEMTEYHAALAARVGSNPSLRCDHDVSLYDPCTDCAAEVAP